MGDDVLLFIVSIIDLMGYTAVESALKLFQMKRCLKPAVGSLLIEQINLLLFGFSNFRSF